jgi:putative tryptophan/tyrosine transport system substrate-binding protein
MQRREFIKLIGGAVAWPPPARAQRPAMPVIGFLHARSSDDSVAALSGFRSGLSELGYIEGQNVTVEYRWGNGQSGRLPALAIELVHLRVDVLVAGAETAALAAKAATSTIPIVFSIGSDPVTLGLVASYNRPGSNATGMNMLTTTLEAKRLGLLHELLPRAVIGVLFNPGYPTAQNQLQDIQEAAQAVGLQISVLSAGTDGEINTAFEISSQQRIGALTVAANPFFDTRRQKLVALAAKHAVPVMYQFREFATAGGLMSYGIDLPDVYRQVGVYAGRILKGTNPADLPVMQPTKYDLVLNMKTARALGLAVPDRLLALADEVIE